VEAALAVAIENADHPQQQQPSSDRKPKRAKKKDGFERVSYADVKEREEAEGYLSEESD
jgi:hypothetical protein